MPANQIDMLLEIWSASLLELGGNPLFTNHTDLYRVIDSMSVGEVRWEIFKITHKHKQDGEDGEDEVIELAQGSQDGEDDQDGPEAPWMSNVYDVESPTLSLPFIKTYTYLPYSCAEYPYISTQYFRSFKDAFHLSVLHQH